VFVVSILFLLPPPIALATSESEKAALAEAARQAGKDCKKVTHIGLPRASSTGATVMDFVCDGYKHYAVVVSPDGTMFIGNRSAAR